MGETRNNRTSLSGVSCRKRGQILFAGIPGENRKTQTYRAARVPPWRIRDRVRMTLEGASLDKVDKVMLAGRPRVARIAGQASRNTDGVIRQDFDVAPGNVATVSVQHDSEPDQHRGEIYGRRGPDVVPAIEKNRDSQSRASRRASSGGAQPTRT